MKKVETTAQDLPTKPPISQDPFDMGWCEGYKDVLPECPYDEGTPESIAWWEGYSQGAMDC